MKINKTYQCVTDENTMNKKKNEALIIKTFSHKMKDFIKRKKKTKSISFA